MVSVHGSQPKPLHTRSIVRLKKIKTEYCGICHRFFWHIIDTIYFHNNQSFFDWGEWDNGRAGCFLGNRRRVAGKRNLRLIHSDGSVPRWNNWTTRSTGDLPFLLLYIRLISVLGQKKSTCNRDSICVKKTARTTTRPGNSETGNSPAALGLKHHLRGPMNRQGHGREVVSQPLTKTPHRKATRPLENRRRATEASREVAKNANVPWSINKWDQNKAQGEARCHQRSDLTETKQSCSEASLVFAEKRSMRKKIQ